MSYSINEITALESRYTDDGVPSLGKSYNALLELWENGEADREACLRLLFLSWYSCSEPNILTGLPEGSKGPLFRTLFHHLGGEQTDDPEVIFTVGIMASSFPYCCGEEDAWAEVGRNLKYRYEGLGSGLRLLPGQFEGRGAYGKYFEHILKKRRE